MKLCFLLLLQQPQPLWGKFFTYNSIFAYSLFKGSLGFIKNSTLFLKIKQTE